MEKMYGKFCLIDGEKEDVFSYEPQDKSPIYEVVRSRNGHLSFIGDHYDRFLLGMEKFSYPKISFEEFKNNLYKLVEINDIRDHNTKIVYENLGGGKFKLVSFLSKSKFPSGKDYEEGIKASILYIEREDPNVKTIRSDYVKRLDENLRENNSFEAIIVDRNNIVKEGGRSNFFMIRDGKIYTAPSKDVLKGIIRNKVYDICREEGFEIVERDIHLEELKKADGLFFTGTGKDVLPIRFVDDFEIMSNKNEILHKIIEKFNILALSE